MYEKKTNQVSFDENPNSFIGAQLISENSWVKMAQNLRTGRYPLSD